MTPKYQPDECPRAREGSDMWTCANCGAPAMKVMVGVRIRSQRWTFSHTTAERVADKRRRVEMVMRALGRVE